MMSVQGGVGNIQLGVDILGGWQWKVSICDVFFRMIEFNFINTVGLNTGPKANHRC